jgi:hypothetical protein
MTLHTADVIKNFKSKAVVGISPNTRQTNNKTMPVETMAPKISNRKMHHRLKYLIWIS